MVQGICSVDPIDGVLLQKLTNKVLGRWRNSRPLMPREAEDSFLYFFTNLATQPAIKGQLATDQEEQNNPNTPQISLLGKIDFV